MKTKIEKTIYKLKFDKDLNKEVWVKDETLILEYCDTKKQAINIIKKMKQFINKHFTIRTYFIISKDYSTYIEDWGCIREHYKIIKA
jgi:ribosomal protein L31E